MIQDLEDIEDVDFDEELPEGYEQRVSFEAAHPFREPPDMELSNEVKANELYKNADVLAKHYIDQFFAKKLMHCGGTIPRRFLHDPKRVCNVINLNIVKGVKRAYKALEHTINEAEKLEAKRVGDSTSDVKLVNETLKLLARSCVPQQFAGGMLLMYLELVEGISFR